MITRSFLLSRGFFSEQEQSEGLRPERSSERDSEGRLFVLVRHPMRLARMVTVTTVFVDSDLPVRHERFVTMASVVIYTFYRAFVKERILLALEFQDADTLQVFAGPVHE